MIDENPIAPFEWRAVYRGGGHLRQFDADGWHRTVDVDRARVQALEVHGHPAGVLTIPVYGGQVPDEVVVRARMELVGDPAAGFHRRRVECHFGFRYGADETLIIIDAQGEPCWHHGGMR